MGCQELVVCSTLLGVGEVQPEYCPERSDCAHCTDDVVVVTCLPRARPVTVLIFCLCTVTQSAHY